MNYTVERVVIDIKAEQVTVFCSECSIGFVIYSSNDIPDDLGAYSMVTSCQNRLNELLPKTETLINQKHDNPNTD